MGTQPGDARLADDGALDSEHGTDASPRMSVTDLMRWYAANRGLLDRAATVLVLAVSYVLLFLNRNLGQYVDESDNLLGGQLIAQGYRLYVDYFSQHMPLPYHVAALASWLGIRELEGYRIFFSILILLVYIYLFLQFRHRLPRVFLYVLIFSISLGHPMFSGHMFLADHFFALSLLIVLLFFLTTADLNFRPGEQIAISLCCFVALQSTLISIYPILLIAAYYVARKHLVPGLAGQSLDWQDEARFVAILVAPHVLTLGLLLSQGMLGPLLDQAIVFNQVYYSRYELASDPLGILLKSLSDSLNYLVAFLLPPALREVQTFLIIANISAVAVLARTRDPYFALFYAALVLLSRMRGDGYHGSPYFMISFVSIAIMLSFSLQLARELWRNRVMRTGPGRRLSWSHGLVGTACVLFVALTLVFYRDIGGFYRHQPRGEGLESPYARAVEAATEPSDRIWAAPFEPYVYLKSGRLPASTYWYYHMWLSDSEEITRTVLHDLETLRPPVVVFRADKEIPWHFPLPAPREFGARVYGYIRDEYVAVDDQDPVLRDVFVRRDEAAVLLQRLADQDITSH